MKHLLLYFLFGIYLSSQTAWAEVKSHKQKGGGYLILMSVYYKGQQLSFRTYCGPTNTAIYHYILTKGDSLKLSIDPVLRLRFDQGPINEIKLKKSESWAHDGDLYRILDNGFIRENLMNNKTLYASVPIEPISGVDSLNINNHTLATYQNRFRSGCKWHPDQKSYLVEENNRKVFHWYLFLAVLLGLGAWGSIHAMQKENRAVRIKLEEDRKKQELQAEKERNRIESEIGLLRNINSQSVSLYESAPIKIQHAAQQLKQAEEHFQRHAYSPFWSSIEETSISLAEFNADLKKITKLSGENMQLRELYIQDVAPFPITSDDIKTLSLSETISKDMQKLTYEAHRDPNMAQIYEQRRTTHTLIVGFKGLHDAIENMRFEIVSSISDLTNEVSNLHDTLIEGNAARARQHNEFMEAYEQNQQLSRNALEEAKSLNTRMEKVSRKLEDIHSGYPPLIKYN